MRKAMPFASALALLATQVPGLAQQIPDSAELAAPSATTRPSETVQPQHPLVQELVGLPVYSSDKQKVGQVNSVDVGANGRIQTLQVEIEGFLGLGSASVRITSDQFAQDGDRIVLTKTADQVRGIPEQAYQPRH